MSTRACYVFKGNNPLGEEDCVTIYKHHDGYPSGGTTWIMLAKDYAKQLATDKFDKSLYPREAMVTGFMACPDITNCKEFTPHFECHGDLNYHYEITDMDKVEIYRHSGPIEGDWNYSLIFEGTIEEAYKKYNKELETG